MLSLHSSEQVTHAGFDERPSALILRLFLRPHNAGILVALEVCLHGLEREWSQLLDSYNRDVLNTTLCALRLKIIVDLATAEDNASDFVISDEILALIVNDLLESQSLAEIFDVRTSCSELQEFFRRNNDGGLTVSSSDLGPQEVEVVCGGRGVDDSHVYTFLMLVDLCFRSWCVFSVS